MPGLLPCPAAVTAFRTLGVRGMALLPPPWFADDEQQRVMAYLRNQGCEGAYANQLRLRGVPAAQPPDPLRTCTELYPAELWPLGRRPDDHPGLSNLGL